MRNLSGARGIDSLAKVISRTQSLNGLVNMDAFTYAVSLANKNEIKEAIKMLAMPQDLREYIENSWLGEKFIEQGVKQGVDELANLLRKGYSLDEALAVIKEKETSLYPQ